MCLSLGGQAKGCASSSGRDTGMKQDCNTTGAGAACPCVAPEVQEHSVPGAREMWVQATVPLIPGAEGAFPPPPVPRSSQCPRSSSKAPEQWPLSLLLRDGDGHRGIKGQREFRQWGSGAPSACEMQGKEGHIQPGLPDTAPSVPPCAAGWPEAAGKQAPAPFTRKQGPRWDRLPAGWVRAHLPL